MINATRKRITIAIHALGGQGGGVLADWLLDVGTRYGWYTQGTSVPGVAQRTGATVYYIELFPGDTGSAPVLALMPVPGDVDVVIASELMEAGRAILRGFVSKDRTTLIGSLHRVYAISEKIAMGNGAASSERIIEAARERARRFVAFDMEAAASRSGSMISSVMLGALAGSSALPFQREAFEDVIRASGIAVEANLRGFAEGFAAAQRGLTLPVHTTHGQPVAVTAAGRSLAARIERELPVGARVLALHGAKRLMDYQDAAYVGLYLDRLGTIAALDDGFQNHALTAELARYLALWMTYEDTIRVADLKVRSSRMERVRGEVKAAPDQIVGVTEFMHPRLREVCESLPARLGHFILNHRGLCGILAPFFQKGRHVQTTSVRWFLALNTLAGMRRWRRGTLRFRDEQARIEAWLALVAQAAREDQAAARELVDCQRLVKGYGDTFDRGLRNFQSVTAVWQTLRGQSSAAEAIRGLREAALADEKGDALATRLNELKRVG